MKAAHLLVAALALVACKKHHAADKAKPDKVEKGELGGEKYRTDQSGYGVDPSLVGSGKTLLVVSEAAPASAAGKAVLAAGGNAVDAAIATAFVLAVDHPTAGNIGGGGFAVVRVPGKGVKALDFREVAPASATETMYLDAAGKPTKDSLFGDRAVGVPGTVAGLWALHEQLGKKPWKELVAPAIALAKTGFPVDAYLHEEIELHKADLARTPATAALWLPGGKPRDTGEIVKLPELAAALERIADKGAAGFYQGATAQAIVDEMKRGGGLITAADLAGYKPEWREPLAFAYRGYRVTGMPLPSSGTIVLAMTANMLGDVDLGKLGWHSAEHVHRLAEVWRRAYAARNEALADPAFVHDDVSAHLVDPAFDHQLAATITAKATPSKDVPPLLDGTHTTNLCTVDATDMAVAMTVTLNDTFGSKVTVGGFLLNDEMDDFTAKPGAENAYNLKQGSANKIEPGKRPLSSMSPIIVEDAKGELAMVAGAGGGARIITAVWQLFSNFVDFHMDIDAAVAAPRVHHQHEPDSVKIEALSVTREVDKALRTMGYKVDWSQKPFYFAHATALVRTPAGWKGTADPRVGGGAAGD